LNKKGGHLLQWVCVAIVSFVILVSINLTQQTIEPLMGRPSGKRIAAYDLRFCARRYAVCTSCRFANMTEGLYAAAQGSGTMITEPHAAGTAANFRTAEYYAKQL
jgi:hypothetical protein